jgi:hypothetical protein
VLPFNQERHSYVYRVMEFCDLLVAGFWSPRKPGEPGGRARADALHLVAGGMSAV